MSKRIAGPAGQVLDLDAALGRVMQEARRAEAPDILRHADFAHAWPKTKPELEALISSGTYLPARPRVIDFPKDSYMLRPLVLLDPADLVVYDAACALVALLIDRALPSSVHSARIAVKDGSYRGQVDQRRAWLRFQRAGRQLHDEMPMALMLTTDVASYFEYVDVKTLTEDLRSLPGVVDYGVDILSRYLNELGRSSPVWGLPQGPAASSILGNFYLLPVDRLLALRPVRYVRYQDDLKVFGASEAELRTALRDIIQLLRARHLSLSVHKTKILTGDEIDKEFEDSRKGAISYGIEIGDPHSQDELRRLFDEATATSPVNTRDVRFTVYRMGKIGDAYALNWILTNLADVPYLSFLLVQYLLIFADKEPAVEEAVATYLATPSRNLYPYVEMQFVRMFSRLSGIREETHRLICQILENDSKDEFVREHAARCVGRHARPGDGGLLRSLFASTHLRKLRRALLVALREAASADKAWLNSVGATDPTLAVTISFLNSGALLPRP